MGLFEKKYCDICGEKIGLLGNRKLEDGNMCKDCARKLSPFFSERRSSTVNEIKQQLEYREQNKQILAGFSPMFTFGEDDKIYIDPMKQSFVVSRRNPGSWSDENPDVIPLSSVTGCNLRVDEDREEIYTQGKDGEKVSYNPPRYKFTYDFYIDIKVFVSLSSPSEQSIPLLSTPLNLPFLILTPLGSVELSSAAGTISPAFTFEAPVTICTGSSLPTST